MAAYVCVHAWCSLILHKASLLSCFRRTFYTHSQEWKTKRNVNPVLNATVSLLKLVMW